jgi:Rod binding domain-containing protein
MWRVAEGFEAMFLDLMMSTMRKTVDESSIFGNSNAMQIYRGMQDQYLAETISKGRQFGLSRLIFDWMCRTRPDIAPAVGRGLDAQKAYLDAARLSVQTGLETIADPAGE